MAMVALARHRMSACVDGWPTGVGAPHRALCTYTQPPSTLPTSPRLSAGGYTQRAADTHLGALTSGTMQALGARMSLSRPCPQPLRASRQCSRLVGGSSRPQVAARVFGGKGDPEKEVRAAREVVPGCLGFAAVATAAAAAAACQDAAVQPCTAASSTRQELS